MRSTISTQVANNLNLMPLGQTRVCHADGESICNYYVINLLLPNKIEIKMLMVNDAVEVLVFKGNKLVTVKRGLAANPDFNRIFRRLYEK